MKRQSVLVMVILLIATFCPCYSAFADLYGTSGSIVAWRQESISTGFVVSTVPVGTGYIAIAGSDTYNLAITPVPSAVILGGLGLTFSGWLLKRKRMV